jgi:hypothetical protein
MTPSPPPRILRLTFSGIAPLVRLVCNSPPPMVICIQIRETGFSILEAYKDVRFPLISVIGPE